MTRALIFLSFSAAKQNRSLISLYQQSPPNVGKTTLGGFLDFSRLKEGKASDR
jgi:hypothetical protein